MLSQIVLSSDIPTLKIVLIVISAYLYLMCNVNVKNGQNGQNGPKWSKLVKNGQNDKNGHNGLKWSKLVNRAKNGQMVKPCL